MTEFKIGDVVWVRAEFCGYRGKRDRLTLKVGDGETVAIEGDCKADIEYDIKQAIREVLLSDEFMAAFAAAWMKTPIPLSNPCDDKGAERVQSLADYPPGEPSEGMAIAPITGSESEAYYLGKLKKGEAK
jgi:hypothetical protein